MKNDLVKKQELFSNLNIMSKNILRNSQYLEKLGRRAKGEATPKVGKILTLYNLRKISQVQTAENVIKLLVSTNQKEVIKGMKKADKIIAKYKDNAPLNQRLAVHKDLVIKQNQNS